MCRAMATRKSAEEQIRELRATVLAKLASDDRARRRAHRQNERRQRSSRSLRWLVFAALVAAAVVSVAR